MKNCTDCKYASWRITDKGRLHPSGDGKCAYVFVMPMLPSAKYWIGGEPRPSGGNINRRRDLREDCPVFERIEQ